VGIRSKGRPKSETSAADYNMPQSNTKEGNILSEVKTGRERIYGDILMMLLKGRAN
jgi:hypothetical protein